MSHAAEKWIRRSTTLALALCLPSLAGAAARGAAGTRPGHAGRPTSPAGTHAAGHATYGHYYSGHHHHHAYGWYGGLGYAYWPYWGLWYGAPAYPAYPTPYPLRETGESRPRPALIEVDVQPGKAELQIDEQAAGEARDFNGRYDLLALKPGQHVLEFSRPGYQTLLRVVTAESDAYLRIDDRLTKGAGLDPRSDERPATPASEDRTAPFAQAPDAPTAAARLADGLLRIRVEPGDAAVYLDGEFLARADELARLHGALPVARGIHSLEVVRPGFQSQTRRVEVQGEQPVAVEIELRRTEPAELR